MLRLLDLSSRAPKYRLVKQRGFTLPELLGVIAVMVLIMGFMGPAINSIKDGRDIMSATYQIQGILEQARNHAIANNTYTWVGFYQENGDRAWAANTVQAEPANPETPTAGDNIGRLIVYSVASKDGTRYPTSTATAMTQTTVANDPGVVGLGRLYKFENLRLHNSTDASTWPADWPRGTSVQNITSSGFPSTGPTFWYPVTGTNSSQHYRFRRIIEFNPYGEASRITDTLTTAPTEWISVGLHRTRGRTDDSDYASSIPYTVLIDSLTGRITVAKP